MTFDILSMVGLKLIHISKRSPDDQDLFGYAIYIWHGDRVITFDYT